MPDLITDCFVWDQRKQRTLTWYFLLNIKPHWSFAMPREQFTTLAVVERYELRLILRRKAKYALVLP